MSEIKEAVEKLSEEEKKVHKDLIEECIEREKKIEELSITNKKRMEENIQKLEGFNKNLEELGKSLNLLITNLETLSEKGEDNEIISTLSDDKFFNA